VLTRKSMTAITATTLLLLTSACSNAGNAGNGDDPEPTTSQPAATEINMNPQGSDGRPPLSDFCGTDPVKVAYVVGFGENSWRKVALAEIEDEATKCDNVTVQYFNASGDQNQFITMINSASAQGFDAIITYDDFGEAAVPALSQAYRSGVVVVPFESDPGGTVGTDYNGFVSLDLVKETQWWGEFFSRTLNSEGSLVYLGGTPGAPLSAEYWDHFAAILAENPGLTMQGDGPIATNWNPSDSQKAVSGLFAQYPDTSALIADYLGGTGPGIVRAYQSAGKDLLPVAGGSSTNELVCMWHELNPTNPDFHLFSADGDVAIGRVALRHAVAIVQGVPNGESWVFQRAVGIDTTQGNIPDCDDSAPADAPLQSRLTPAQLAEVFAR